MLLKLKYDGPLSNFGFNFNLRRYSMVMVPMLVRAWNVGELTGQRLGGGEEDAAGGDAAATEDLAAGASKDPGASEDVGAS